MFLPTTLKQLVRDALVLLLLIGFVGSVLPYQAHAQPTFSDPNASGGDQLLGGPTSGGQGNGWISQIVNAVTGNTGNTGAGGSLGDAPSGSGWFGSGGGSGGSSGGFNIPVISSFLDAFDPVLDAFDPVVGAAFDYVLDPIADVFTSVFDPVVDVGESIIAEGVTYLDNTFNNSGVTGDPIQGQNPGMGGSANNGAVIQGGQTIRFANGYNLTLSQGETATVHPNGSVTINLANGHTAVISPDGYTTEYDAQGQAINSNDPTVNPGNYDGRAGSGNGPSIPGASVGTVGNPFSDGTDKNDAPSNNDETTSNPYLFEYDPSSTNNNPSGAGAQTQ